MKSWPFRENKKNWDWEISQVIRYAKISDIGLLDGLEVVMFPEFDYLKIDKNYDSRQLVEKLKVHLNWHWEPKVCHPKTCFEWRNMIKKKPPIFVRKILVRKNLRNK
jgi:hypothetical protein